MKIISAGTNILLASGNAEHYFRGCITGPIRAVCGVVQLALNAIAVIFSALPSARGWIRSDSAMHTYNLLKDASTGLAHICRGLIEFLPGSYFLLDMYVDGRNKVLTSDHPFYPYQVDEWS